MDKVRSTLTPTAKQMAGMNIVIDKMHFKGHVDSWCTENCDPYKFEALKEVNVQSILYIHNTCIHVPYTYPYLIGVGASVVDPVLTGWTDSLELNYEY